MERVLLAWPFATLDDAALGNVRSFLEGERAPGSSRDVGVAIAADGDEALAARARELTRDLDPDASFGCLVKPAGERDPSYNRNLLLLAGAGSRVIMTDGDIACRPARLASRARRESGEAGGSRAAPAYSDARYAPPVTICRDRAEAVSLVEPADAGGDFDVLEAHLAYLGADTTDLFPDEGVPGGFVFMTSPGTYGDSGFSLARGSLSLDGPARDRLMANGYERCKLSRETVRVPERDVVSPSTRFLGMQAGYDARNYAPPFLPVGRNQDGLYALLARALLPGSLTAYPAFGLLHAPVEPRSHDPATLTSFEPSRAELFMAFAAGLCPPAAMTDPRERTAELGARFRGASGLSASDLVDLAYGPLADAAMARAETIQGLLERYARGNGTWARDAEEHLDNVFAFLREPASVFTVDGGARSVGAVRADLDRFGRFLSVWPELFDRAKEMNRDGRGIARPLAGYRALS